MVLCTYGYWDCSTRWSVLFGNVLLKEEVHKHLFLVFQDLVKFYNQEE
jgi:hypothetical protein